MTECITEVLFSNVCKKKVSVDFSGGQLSSDGGFLLLREIEKNHGYAKRFSSCLHDPREQRKVHHSQHQLITQRVYQICAGYEDANDSNTLRGDKALQLACSVLEKELASQPTMTRLENRVTRADIKRIRQCFITEYINYLPKTCKEIVLDIDGFADETHGSQQLSFYHGFYRHKMYYPFFITDAPSGFPVLLQLRAGNVHCGKQVKSLLRWLLWRLKKARPCAQIVLRGDAGFSLPEIMTLCERCNVLYAFGYRRNAVLERANQYLLEQACALFESTGEKARCFADIFYMAGSWVQPRRIIMKAECMVQGTNQRFVVTNMSDDAQNIYDTFYVLRGEHSENRIKELKLDMKADRLSCHQFIANQFRLFLHQLAYLFLWKLRCYAKNTSVASARFATLRNILIKRAVRIKESVRRVWCQFSSSTPHKEIFSLIARKIILQT